MSSPRRSARLSPCGAGGAPRPRLSAGRRAKAAGADVGSRASAALARQLQASSAKRRRDEEEGGVGRAFDFSDTPPPLRRRMVRRRKPAWRCARRRRAP
eukprot:6213912-Pleurochrysis_carterae.AAC.8